MRNFIQRLLRARIHLNALSIASPNLPENMPELRIAIAADIQAGGIDVDLDVVDEVVDTINACNPDLVLMPGEFAIHGKKLPGSVRYDKTDIASRIGRVRARLGAYAVLGNHDWEHGEAEGYEMRDALEAKGVHVLENRNKSFTFGYQGKTHALCIAGLSDIHTRTPDMTRAFNEVAPGTPTILLTHNPKIFESLRRDVALMVAGHTHGGQFRPLGSWSDPLIRAIPPKIPYGRCLRDHFEHMHGPGFISQGIGTSVLPLRLACRRHVDVITLTPQPFQGQAEGEDEYQDAWPDGRQAHPLPDHKAA
jgi:hypothetical protein